MYLFLHGILRAQDSIWQVVGAQHVSVEQMEKKKEMFFGESLVGRLFCTKSWLKRSNHSRRYPSTEIKEPQTTFTPRRDSQLQCSDSSHLFRQGQISLRNLFWGNQVCSLLQSLTKVRWEQKDNGILFFYPSQSNLQRKVSPVGWEQTSNLKVQKSTTWCNKIKKRHCLVMNEKKSLTWPFAHTRVHWH